MDGRGCQIPICGGLGWLVSRMRGGEGWGRRGVVEVGGGCLGVLGGRGAGGGVIIQFRG